MGWIWRFWIADSVGVVWQITDGFYQPSFFVVELIIICPIFKKPWQESQESLLVHDEEFLHL